MTWTNAAGHTDMLLGALVLLGTVAPISEADGRRHPCGEVEADPTAPLALLVGDSNMTGSFGRQLTADLRRLGYRVQRTARSGSGLARPDFFDWHRRARALVASCNPDVVVLILGGNDGQRLARPRAGEGRGVRWARRDVWLAEYQRRARALAGDLTQYGARLFLLGPTNRRPKRARERMRRILKAQRAAVAGMERVTWVDTFELTSAPDGRFLAGGPDPRSGRRTAARRRVRYRWADGIHMTPAGAAALRARLIPLLLRHGIAMSRDTLDSVDATWSSRTGAVAGTGGARRGDGGAGQHDAPLR